jgi:dolichol kinase
MLELIIAGGLVAAVVLVSEIIGRKKLASQELTRKLPHIALALFFAVQPFYISFQGITYLAILCLLGFLMVDKLGWFIHARTVKRKTYGEIFFSLGAVAASLITHDKWIFAAAMLNLGLADSAAALVGIKKGKHSFKIFSQKKSLEGSLTFTFVSALIAAWVVLIVPAGFRDSWPIIIWLPILAASSEALLPYGADNLVIPVLIALAFRLA